MSKERELLRRLVEAHRIWIKQFDLGFANAFSREALAVAQEAEELLSQPDELDRLRAENEALRMAMAGVRSIESDFRWESEKQQHIPTLTLMFVPVPYNSPNDGIGWRNRDTLRAVIESVWRESDQKEQGE